MYQPPFLNDCFRQSRVDAPFGGEHTAVRPTLSHAGTMPRKRGVQSLLHRHVSPSVLLLLSVLSLLQDCEGRIVRAKGVIIRRRRQRRRQDVLE